MAGIGEMFKICPKCGKHRPLCRGHFYESNGRLSLSRCIPCDRRRRRAAAADEMHVAPCPRCGGGKRKRAKLCRTCNLSLRRGSAHPSWRGGRVTKGGYVRVMGSGRDGYVFEHRVVMESILGRRLFTNENVHHKNGVRADNRPENLELWVKSQPCGQRAEDLVMWAREIIERYGDQWPV